MTGLSIRVRTVLQLCLRSRSLLEGACVSRSLVHLCCCCGANWSKNSAQCAWRIYILHFCWETLITTDKTIQGLNTTVFTGVLWPFRPYCYGQYNVSWASTLQSLTEPTARRFNGTMNVGSLSLWRHHEQREPSNVNVGNHPVIFLMKDVAYHGAER